MRIRTIAGLFALVLTAASCADQPTAPKQATLEATEASFAKKTKDGSLLTNIPVAGTLAGGGTFAGSLNVTSLNFQNGDLLATGTLTGTVTRIIDGATVVTQVTQTFTNVLLGLTSNGGQCRILTLDLGPLNLDLLGLIVDLSAVSLDITAQSGPGNLLGNLLCALVGLLDNPNALLGDILDLLGNINRILG